MAVVLLISSTDFRRTTADVDCCKPDGVGAGALVKACVVRRLSNINERSALTSVDEECRSSDVVDSSSANRRKAGFGNSEKPEVEKIESSKPKLLCCVTEVASATLLQLPVKL